MTSAVKVPAAELVTVRQTPLTAIESPLATSLVTSGPRTVSRAASPRSSRPTISPSSSTIPVNIRASLLGAELLLAPGVRGQDAPRRRIRHAARVLPPIRTLTVGPGVPPGQPGLHAEHWVADCHRRFGISPTPEHASYLSTFCHR